MHLFCHKQLKNGIQINSLHNGIEMHKNFLLPQKLPWFLSAQYKLLWWKYNTSFLLNQMQTKKVGKIKWLLNWNKSINNITTMDKLTHTYFCT